MATRADSIEAIREIGSTRWRTASTLLSLEVSHDGSMIAAGGPDLRLFDAADGTLRRRITGLAERARHLCFSRQDATIAVADGGRLDVWAVGGARGFRRPWRAVALTPDGDHGFLAAVAVRGKLSLRRVPSGEALGEIPRDARVVTFSPDGAIVALAPRDQPGVIELWRGGVVTTLRGPSSFHYDQHGHDMWDEPTVTVRTVDARITALAFDPTGSRLATGGDEPIVRLWDVATGALLHEVDIGEREVGGLAWGDDAVAVTFDPIVGGPGPARLWRVPSTVETLGPGRIAAWQGGRWLRGGLGSQILHTPDAGDGGSLEGLAVSPDGRVIVHKTNTFAEARWFATGERIWRDEATRLTYCPMAFGPAGGWMPDARYLDPSPFGVRRFTLEGGPTPSRLAPTPTLTWSLDASPDGRFVAVCGFQDAVQIWDTRSLAVVATLVGTNLHAVRFFPRGALTATSEGTLREYRWEGDPAGNIADLRTMSPSSPASKNDPNDEAHHLAIRGDRAVSAWNDVVRVWDLRSGTEVAASPPINRFAGVKIVGFDGDEPYGVVMAKTGRLMNGGTAATRWSPKTGVVPITTSPDPLWRWAARGAALPGGGFVLSGDDDVLRVYPAL